MTDNGIRGFPRTLDDTGTNRSGPIYDEKVWERKVRSLLGIIGLMVLLSPFLLLGIDPGNPPALACTVGIGIAAIVVLISILGSSTKGRDK